MQLLAIPYYIVRHIDVINGFNRVRRPGENTVTDPAQLLDLNQAINTALYDEE